MKLVKDKDLKESHRIFVKAYGKKISFAEFYDRWHDSAVFLIREKCTVGYVLLTPRNEVGAFVLPQFQKKKYATNAIKILMKDANRKYYWALINFTNKPSLKFFQSLGFLPQSLVYGIDNEVKS